MFSYAQQKAQLWASFICISSLKSGYRSPTISKGPSRHREQSPAQSQKWRFCDPSLRRFDRIPARDREITRP